MTQLTFPPLPLNSWQDTRNTIQTYAQVISKVRRTFSPHQKHWWHVSLHTTATGLTTTPILANGLILELQLDFLDHQLLIVTNQGERLEIPLEGQSPAEFCTEVCDALATWHIYPDDDQVKFDDNTPGTYDKTAVAAFWRALSQIDAIFKEFKAGFQREETSPVQLWPHHFDLAVVWFSGRLVQGEEEEQMNFGFVTGDESVPEPYFYATAYPLPTNFAQTSPPQHAVWQTEGWAGMVLHYAQLVNADNPNDTLLTFLQEAHQIGTNALKQAT